MPTLSYIALSLAGAALLGCARSGAEEPATVVDQAAVVRAAPVADTVLARPVVATGTIAPADEAALGFKIGGVIVRIAVDEGDDVRAGQTLASLDLREIGAALARARSGAAKAERDLGRARRLYADSVVALAEFQDTETAHEVAQADLETAAVNRHYAVIVAPANGVVLRRAAEPGENISAGATVLVVGSRGAGGGYVLEVGLADRDAVSVRKGDPALARFDALPGREFAGRVFPDRRGRPPRDRHLRGGGRAGRRGRARRWSGGPGGDPSRARRAGDAGSHRVRAGGRRRRGHGLRPLGRREASRAAAGVTVAFIEGRRVAIAAGLEGASQVLTDGAAYLDDGAAVRVAP